MEYKYLSNSYEETERLGRAAAGHLKNGIIALSGELGAGKTAFIRGIARGLGYTGRVTSPTFSLVNEYLSDDGRPLLYHFDLFRIKAEELMEIGWCDYIESGVPCAVEWAEIAGDELPPDAVRVEIGVLGENSREITIAGLDKINLGNCGNGDTCV
jgi:tRNA threonylcarbamoyladenosine biosynthesis protein TsaE